MNKKTITIVIVSALLIMLGIKEKDSLQQAKQISSLKLQVAELKEIIEQ